MLRPPVGRSCWLIQAYTENEFSMQARAKHIVEMEVVRRKPSEMGQLPLVVERPRTGCITKRFYLDQAGNAGQEESSFP